MSKFIWVIKFLLFPTLIVSICFFWMLDPFHFGAPSDAKLINVFQSNRATFEEMRNMARLEGEAIIIPKRINAKIPPSRKARYDRLLEQVGSPTLISGSERIKWVYASGGISTTGSEWTKGISFDLNCDQKDQRSSLDVFPEPLEEAVYCRSIEGSWWVNVSIWI